jgi:hypothetical protein
MNMMKLVQELQGMAELNHRRPQPRNPGPLMLQFHSPTLRIAITKRRIRIDFQDQPDIPHPVRITHSSQAR